MDIVTLALAKKSAKQYTDDAIEGLGKGIIYKGAVNYYNDLPNNASIGDCYSVLYKGTSGMESFGAEYVWGRNNNQGELEWIQLGSEDIYNELGNLSDLTTISKENIVSALNEVNGKIETIGLSLDNINGEVI